MKTADIRLPSNIQDAITQGHREISEHQRFQTNYPSGVLRGFTPEQKLQHLRDSVFNALAQVGRDDGGQPPMIERFREATIWVDFLESKGVPFGVCQKSKMNQALLG